MKTKTRYGYLSLLSLLLAVIVIFLVHTSEDTRWGHTFWEEWAVRHWNVTPAFAAEAVFWVRKTFHFLGYGTVSLLFWLYFFLWRLPRPMGTGIIATGIVASFDEYLQSTTTFRGGTPQDVLLDLAGAITLTLAVKWWMASRKRREG